MEYEIDLRRWINAVVRRWRLIVSIGVLAALIAAGWSYLRPTEYWATSTVLLIVTETGAQVGASEPLLNLQSINAESRRASLSAIAQNRAIEAALPPEVVQAVAPDNYKVGMLLQRGWLRFGIQGDLLEISASGTSPENAVALADAWADTFVTNATPLYTDEFSEIKRATSAVLPYEASGRGIVRNAVTAGLLGLVLGVAVALLLEVAANRSQQSRSADNERVVVSKPSPTR